VEARSRGRVGVHPVGAPNATRGSASSHRVTPACLVRIPWMRKPLKPGLGNETSWPTSNPVDDNDTKGWGRREAPPLPGRENLCKRKPKGVTGMKQGWRGCRRNQSAKRLKKPEGAAQPGEASPVLVAACFCKRRRVPNPMKGGQEPLGRLLESRG
jgi:hypothetical protein